VARAEGRVEQKCGMENSWEKTAPKTENIRVILRRILGNL
jgi:hypothetical protein